MKKKIVTRGEGWSKSTKKMSPIIWMAFYEQKRAKFIANPFMRQMKVSWKKQNWFFDRGGSGVKRKNVDAQFELESKNALSINLSEVG